MVDIIYGSGATITGLSGNTITCTGTCPATPGDISNANHNIVIQAGATVNANVFAGRTIAASFDIQDGTIDPSAFGSATLATTYNGAVTISGGTFDPGSNANNAFRLSIFNAPVNIFGGNFSVSSSNNRCFFGSTFNTNAPLIITNGTFSMAASGFTNLLFQGATFNAPVQISNINSSSVANNQSFLATIFNTGAPLTITGGTFSASGINFLFQGATFKAPVEISGISSSSTATSFFNQSFELTTYTASAPLTINSGTFSGVNTAAFTSITVNSLLTIKGGTFTGTSLNTSFSSTNLGNSVFQEIHISGGTFAGASVQTFSKGSLISGTANPTSTGLCISGGTFSSCAFQNLALSGYLSISGGTFTGTSGCTNGFFTVNTIDPAIAVCILKGVSYPSTMFYVSSGTVPCTHNLAPYLNSTSNGTTITCASNPCIGTTPACPLLQDCCSCPLPAGSLALALTDISCNGNGRVKAQVTGGTSGTTCAASGSLCAVTGPANGVYCVCIKNDLTNVTTCQCTDGTGNATFAGLSPSTPYTVTATDAASNTRSCFITTVANPAILTCNIIKIQDVSCNSSNCPASGNDGDGNSRCSNGKITVGGIGGTGVYTIVLTNTTTSTTYTFAGVANGGSHQFTALPQGTYSATVTDANGCVCTTSNQTITAPATPLSATCAETHAISCNGVSDGEITVTVIGGTVGCNPSTPVGCPCTGATANASGYCVCLYKGASCASDCTTTGTLVGTCKCTTDPGSGAQTAVFTGLGTGTYCAIATDANCCKSCCTKTLAAPSALTATITQTAALCNTANCPGTPSSGSPAACYGSINISSISGGTLCSPSGTCGSCGTSCSGTYCVAITGGPTIVSPTCVGTGGQAFSVLPGTYTVTLSDANGCTVSFNGDPATGNTFSITVGGPLLMTVSATPTTNLICNPGNCPPNAASSICSAVVNVTVTNGTTGTCSLIGSGCGSGTGICVLLTPISGDLTAIPSQCATGSGPYTTSFTLKPSQTTVYTVKATDANGCVATATTNVTVTVAPLLTLTTPTVMDVTCNGFVNGTITVTAGGGNPLSTCNSTTCPNATNSGSNEYCACLYAGACPLTSIPVAVPLACQCTSGGVATFGSTAQNGGYGPGTYCVVITDGNGCSVSRSATIGEPTALTIGNCSTTPSKACPPCDGTMTISGISGGTPIIGEYIVSVDGGAGVPTSGQSHTFTGLCAGSHTITVTDANSCQATCTKTVAGTPPLLSTCATTPASRASADNGSLTVVVTGGTPGACGGPCGAGTGYCVSLVGPTATTPQCVGSTAIFVGLRQGAYTATITDSKGCVSSCVSVVGALTPRPSGDIIILPDLGAGAREFILDGTV